MTHGKLALGIAAVGVLLAASGCSSNGAAPAAKAPKPKPAASSVTVVNAPTVDPKAHVLALIDKLNKGGYDCSVAKSVAMFPGTSAKPDSWIMGPASLSCLHGTDGQVSVSAYSNAKQRAAADEFLTGRGDVFVSGPDWNVDLMTSPTDAKAVAAALR